MSADPPRGARNAGTRALGARRALASGRILLAALGAGAVAVGFARLCDAAMAAHARIFAAAPRASLLLLPFGFAAVVWLTGRFAPEAAGSGIPQVIAAAEERRSRAAGARRVTLWTAAWKTALAAALLVCGGSIGREGPTVQVAAAVVRSVTRGLKGWPGRRAMIVAGGAAGVAAAFNTPIAGIVFSIEELARGFEARTQGVVMLVVVTAGLASYALQGDYAYFGELGGRAAPAAAWLAAPLIGAAGGLFGGVFSRVLGMIAGPGEAPVARWRRAHPTLFAFACGWVAVAAAAVSGGQTFGAGYAEARGLLRGGPALGADFAGFKAIATLAAAASGAPGGIFAPSLATGAGLGGAFSALGWGLPMREAVVLGMCAYLSGVVQAPLTSAVILMEMTRDPGLVGPLLTAALVARWVSRVVCPEPIYHLLSRGWRLKDAVRDARAAAR